MRLVSLNARQRPDRVADDDVEVALIKAYGDELDEPVYLSTDNGERLSLEPLAYGTRSVWDGEATTGFSSTRQDYLFAAISAGFPDDVEGSLPSATLVFENLHSGLAKALRDATEVFCDLAIVMASTPDQAEQQFFGLRMSDVGGDATRITVTLAYEPASARPYPKGRMTRNRFPGLHP